MVYTKRIARVLVLFALSLIPFGLRAEPTAQDQPSFDNWIVCNPISFENLTLYPITNSEEGAAADYITLDEGLSLNQVTVRETTMGATNQLYVTNNSDHPLYAQAGEVTLGGRQDRSIGRDYVVPPRRADAGMNVYCVEYGRWTGQPQFASTAISLASNDIRLAAQKGSYVPSSLEPLITDASSTTTNSKPSAAQTTIWSTVARKNAAFGTKPGTTAYREVLQLKGGHAGQDIMRYMNAIHANESVFHDASGIAAAINGKIVSVDLYNNRSLFLKLWPKLVRLLAADAAITRVKTSYVEPNRVDVQNYIEHALKGKVSARAKDASSESICIESDASSAFVTSVNFEGKSNPIHINILTSR